jgi:Flp pilus assembly protein TadG
MKQRSSRRRGVAAVELAFVLPLIALLVVGVWEVGRMVEVQQLLTNAAREGGREAATGTKDAAYIKNVVVNYLKVNGVTAVTAEDVKIENKTNAARPDPTQAEQMDEYRVTVTIPFNSVRWIIMNQITTTTTLSAYADWFSMRDIPITVNVDIPLE